MPKISILMGVYNHGSYVSQSIQSVLDQTYGDFELLIADDGSTDNSCNHINQFNDARIKVFFHKENRGACIILNELINKAKGDYIAIINSDDYWPCDKLKYQINFLEKNFSYEAIFGRAAFINSEGIPISKNNLSFRKVFVSKNRSSSKWLRHFFDIGNCLCHPTILIRKSSLDILGPYNNLFRQLPDFDMWIRFCKKYKFYISDKELIFFRILPGENTSSITNANSIRAINETYLIAKNFFKEVSKDMLIEGFSDIMTFLNLPTEEHLDIEKVLLYFVPNPWLGHVYKTIGIEKLFELLKSPSHKLILKKDYKIDDIYFQMLTSQSDAFRSGFPLNGLSSRILLEELKKRIIYKIKNKFYKEIMRLR